MGEYVVIVRRVVARHLRVSASSSNQARAQILKEGLQHAWESGDVVNEVETYHINATYPRSTMSGDTTNLA